MPAKSPDCDYERQRAARIEENRRKMQELGLHTATQALQQAAAGESKPRAAPQPRKKRFEIEVEVRRSGRLRGNQPESYAEDQLFSKIGIDRVDLIDAPKRRRINIDPNKLAKLRERAGDEAPRGPIDSGRGVRIQGGRVYDSKYGVTCHWCRQKTLEDHVTCTHPDCGGGRKLAVSFCKMCLMNRHGEDIAQAEASGAWICPPCRGSCGEGCTACCNCGPCRKKAGLGPTHQIIKEVRTAGFTNAHDYLVGKMTGEAQEVIAARKEAHNWGAWLKVPYEPAPSEDEEEQQAPQEEWEQQATAPEAQSPSPAAEPAAAAALAEIEPMEEEGQQHSPEEEEGQVGKPAAAGPRRATRLAAAAAKVSHYFAVTKASEEVQAAAGKCGDAKLTRKERIMRKLGLASRQR